MKDLLRKLNYREQRRIAVINAGDSFIEGLTPALEKVIIDREIDQRCPYEFIMVFVRSAADVERLAPVAIHNLTADGVLWFCYPKKSSSKPGVGLDRDHGWKVLNDSGFHGIRMVSVDDEWAAFRFRNAKYIKSLSDRFNH